MLSLWDFSDCSGSGWLKRGFRGTWDLGASMKPAGAGLVTRGLDLPLGRETVIRQLPGKTSTKVLALSSHESPNIAKREKALAW